MADSSMLLLKLSGLWLLLVAGGVVLASWTYAPYRRLVREADPALRAACRLTYGLLPLLIASGVILLVTRPSLAGLFIPDHCHGTACGDHVPTIQEATWASGLLATFGGLTLVALILALAVLALHALGRMRIVRRLTRLTDRVGAYRLVDSASPFACCIGLWRPEILVSRGMEEALDEKAFAAVLAHERAHAMRRDNLQGFVLHTATRFWPQRVRDRIREDHGADAEQACDRVAERVTGSQGAVAAAIQAIRTPLSVCEAGPGRAFGAGALEERIAALEAPRRTGRQTLLSVVSIMTLLIVSAGLIGTLTGVSHWFMEWLASVGW